MKPVKSGLITLIFLVTFVNFCLGQTGKYRDKLRPNVKAKLDSLYPNATSYIVLNDKYVSDTTQEISINCHCPETEDLIKLVFDTNGSVRYKEVAYTSIDRLPDTIVSYLKNKSDSVRLINDYMIKSMNGKKEITYGALVKELKSKQPGEYIYTFKESGEYISKEPIPVGEQ